MWHKSILSLRGVATNRLAYIVVSGASVVSAEHLGRDLHLQEIDQKKCF